MRWISMVLAAVLAAGPAVAQVIDRESVAIIKAANQGWDIAANMAADSDPVTQDVLMWMRLRAGEGEVADYQAFLQRRPDWPGLDRLRRAGEPSVVSASADTQVLAFFADSPPQTGEGAARFASALIATGKPEQAQTVLRDAWITLRLTEGSQTALMDAHSEALAPFHFARADALLWRWRTSDAQRMLPLLDPPQRRLVAARIGYIRKAGNLPSLVSAVPANLRQDPGLAYDRYNWLADQGNRTEAVKMVLERSTSRASLAEPARWAGWRRSLARWEMREGRAAQAYQLASRHYLSDGAAYADLEWLSGYLSLTYLDKPEQALGHFQAALTAVRTPISLSRMHYWAARAHEAMQADDLAAMSYEAAAEHQTAFYGLLAAEKLGRSLDPAFAQKPVVPRSDVFEQDLTRAAFLLLAAGERGHAVTFFADIGATMEPGGLALIGAVLDAMDEQYYTLLLGKRAQRRGVMVSQNLYPVHDLAQLDLPVDPALALAIARQESEFNIGVGSPVGALGLMQLMPATAQEVAGFLDLPYARARLTTDWEYNATLGAKYLSILQEDFGQTPVMIAAGYNAGPSRPKRWMDERGDPRVGEMDVVDWIEHIPFRETRNYVMRVTEGIPIYRARLSGQAGPIAFTDLLVGVKPQVRPIARPLPQAIGERPSIRPIIRPVGG